MSETSFVHPLVSSQDLAEYAAVTSDLDTLFAPDELTYPLRLQQRQILDSAELVPSDSWTWDIQHANFLTGYVGGVPYPQSPSPIIDSLPPSSFGHLSSGIMDASIRDRVVPKAPKLFGLHAVQSQRLSLNRDYVLCTLRSWPRMMLPGNSPPPFIHPYLWTQDGRIAQDSLPKPLANCAAIMQMCSVKNESNVAIIWRAIRMEHERLSLEVWLPDHNSRALTDMSI